MITLLASALLAAAPPPPRCSMDRVDACAGMFELANAPGFRAAVRRFVGPGRSTWYEVNSDRAGQLLGAFNGASDSGVPVGGDLLRFDACYPHVCSIRGALFISRRGEIRGAALIYPDCGRKATCAGDEDLKLTILRDPRHPAVADLARDWARSNVAAVNARFPAAADKLGPEEVVDVPGSRPRRRR